MLINLRHWISDYNTQRTTHTGRVSEIERVKIYCSFTNVSPKRESINLYSIHLYPFAHVSITSAFSLFAELTKVDDLFHSRYSVSVIKTCQMTDPPACGNHQYDVNLMLRPDLLHEDWSFDADVNVQLFCFFSLFKDIYTVTFTDFPPNTWFKSPPLEQITDHMDWTTVLHIWRTNHRVLCQISSGWHSNVTYPIRPSASISDVLRLCQTWLLNDS